MLEIFKRLDCSDSLTPDYTLLLTHEERCRARLKTTTITGEDVGIFFEHGRPLIIGETLLSSCGNRVRVEGAIEPVVCANCDDPLLFARACYHLGNRHVKIHISELTLAIAPDHVLESMLQNLGLDTQRENMVFVPENGAYFLHDHSHTKDPGQKVTSA